MKNLSCYITVFGTLVVFLIFLSGCKPHTLVVDEAKTSDSNNLGHYERNTFELIFSGLPQDSICPLKKALKIIPAGADCNTGDDKIERCSCSNDIQKWTIDSNLFNIEEAISAVREKGGGGREGVDINFTFQIPKIDSTKIGERPGSKFADIIDSPENVIVAILDTGVNVSAFNQGEASFLNTKGMNENCQKEDNFTTDSPTGWNFIENNADTSDGHGHGTFIALNIMQNLVPGENAKKYSFLPLKVFDNRGKGSYWNIVCALAYIEELREHKDYDVAIVNASFGINIAEEFYNNEFSILKHNIDSLEGASIIVSSAGNKGFDNDKKHHFPSSFSSKKLFNSSWSKNIASVAGLDATIYNDPPVIQLNTESNFGLSSVNSAAPWFHKIEGLDLRFPIYDNNGRLYNGVDLKGTSYSASYFTAKILESILLKNTPQRGADLLDSFIQNLPKSQGIINQVSDGRYLK